MRKAGRKSIGSQGFTLVELMLALVISSIILAAIFMAYQGQQKHALVQEQVVEMQQQLRAAMDIMSRDIRLAGYDPSRSGQYGVASATGARFVFTADNNEDGGAPGAAETLTYELYTTGDGRSALRKIAGQGAVAENIEYLEFLYTLDDGTQTLAPTGAELARIKAVTVSLVARAEKIDRKFFSRMTYTTASGAVWAPTPDDHYRRRFLMTTVQCRNMGI